MGRGLLRLLPDFHCLNYAFPIKSPGTLKWSVWLEESFVLRRKWTRVVTKLAQCLAMATVNPLAKVSAVPRDLSSIFSRGVPL
jgi:hypothetical protein